MLTWYFCYENTGNITNISLSKVSTMCIINFKCVNLFVCRERERERERVLFLHRKPNTHTYIVIVIVFLHAHMNLQWKDQRLIDVLSRSLCEKNDITQIHKNLVIVRKISKNWK